MDKTNGRFPFITYISIYLIKILRLVIQVSKRSCLRLSTKYEKIKMHAHPKAFKLPHTCRDINR